MTGPGTRAPTFSVLIATYNAAGTLDACLDSLAAQAGAAFEILVADGGSTDGTRAIIERRSNEFAHRVFEPDEGPYDAWNKLLPHARGTWLMFLGADDRLSGPDTLAKLARRCAALPERRPDLSYVFGVTRFVAGDDVIENFGTRPIDGDRHDLAGDFPFSHTGLLHHRDLFAQFGPFSTRYAIAGDAHFLLRSAQHPATRFYHVDLPVARMAAGGLSSGVGSRVKCYHEVEMARRELGIAPVRPGWLKSLQRRSAAAAMIDRLLGERMLLVAANIYRRLTGRPVRRHYR